jgi:hypothetical protein
MSLKSYRDKSHGLVGREALIPLVGKHAMLLATPGK